MIGLGRRRKIKTETSEAGQPSGDLSAAVVASLPKHIAIIMDGNGRWACARGMPRVEGHRAGAKTVRMVVEECRRLGVHYLTLYCFSSENWLRPEQEVSALMKLFQQYLESEVSLLTKNGVRLRVIGDMSRLPAAVKASLQVVIDKTKAQKDMDLILAISYGGRDEIVNAVKEIARKAKAGTVNPETICYDTIREHLYAPDVPDPELLIRTSGEFRISNFLLWQIAYSEVVVSNLFWPDFSKEGFACCLKEYAGRSRRFGMTAEQIAASSALNKK